jgi:hypothetical protein
MNERWGAKAGELSAKRVLIRVRRPLVLAATAAGIALASVPTSTSAVAACTWSFTWYCGSSACDRALGRHSGTVGPFATEAQCESGRDQFRMNVGRVGGGIRIESCTRTGICDEPQTRRTPPGEGPPPSVTPPGQTPPPYDYEAERRRQEEQERQRREAEERERQARARAEEEERQRKFLQDKIEALKTLKGSGFDTPTRGEAEGDVPLKGSIPTLGIKMGPTSDEGEKESLFAKGSRFSAPIDLRVRSPKGKLTIDTERTGHVTANERLGDIVEAKDWPVDAKAKFLIGMIMLERGRYEEAITLIGGARARTGDDPLVVSAMEVATSKRDQAVPVAQADFTKRLGSASIEARAAYLAGWERLEIGDIEFAVQMFRRARSEAKKLSSDDAAHLDRVIREVEKQVKPKTALDRKLEAEWRKEAQQRAKAEAAVKLALALSDDPTKAHDARAIAYYREARAILSDRDYGYIDQSIQDIQTGISLRGWLVGKPPLYASRGEAILDALQYGHGNIDASVRYLEDANRYADDRLAVRDAYNFLQGMRAEMKGAAAR